MVLKQQTDLEITPCFVLVWKDDDGNECDAKKCSLYSHCQHGWNMWQVEKAESVRPVIPVEEKVPQTQLLVPEIEPQSKKRRRNKYRGSLKYSRTGYIPGQRFCDELLAVFMAELPSLPVLPKKWGKSGIGHVKHLGRVTLAATKSYHAIYIDFIPYVRIWTDSANSLRVDIVAELMVELSRMSDNLGATPEGTLHLTKPVPTPEKSWEKYMPCTHVVRIRTKQGATAVAQVVKAKFL